MKITVWIRAAAVGLIVTLVGCATSVPLETPSGKPEITIENAKLEEVKNALTNAALDWGYTVKSVTDYSAVYEKANSNALSNALLASQYDPNTRWRLTYSLANLGGSVRVVTDIALVTNPGSAFERLTDFSASQDAQQFQKLLIEVKRRLESEYTVRGRGKVGIALDPKLVIVQVRDDSPAALAGLKVGDRVVRIDGEPMLDYATATVKITGEPGTVVKFEINRQGEELELPVTRGQP